MYLDEQELFDLRRSLETIRDIVRFLTRTTEDEEMEESTSPYPCLLYTSEMPAYTSVHNGRHAPCPLTFL